MIHPTIETLRRLRLTGMAKALEEQQGLPDGDRLSFDDRILPPARPRGGREESSRRGGGAPPGGVIFTAFGTKRR